MVFYTLTKSELPDTYLYVKNVNSVLLIFLEDTTSNNFRNVFPVSVNLKSKWIIIWKAQITIWNEVY